jgi:hypothetical protein
MTAYFGLLEVGQPEPRGTVVVSTAAGAVGQMIGQIAKIMGCKVLGITGSPEKMDFVVNDQGFDHGINDKIQDVHNAIPAICPEGIDVYFDNVGGQVTDAVFENIHTGVRIAVCGQISQYSLKQSELAPHNLAMLGTRHARMEGFLVNKFAGGFDQARTRIAGWIEIGQLRYREDVVERLQNAPKAFIGMMTGQKLWETTRQGDRRIAWGSESIVGQANIP